jgi:hypothetical protein
VGLVLAPVTRDSHRKPPPDIGTKRGRAGPVSPESDTIRRPPRRKGGSRRATAAPQLTPDSPDPLARDRIVRVSTLHPAVSTAGD